MGDTSSPRRRYSFEKSGRQPFWGWGLSSGKQFKDKKFDYCILIAAEKDAAYPKHIFVIDIKEMIEETMGPPRKSGLGYNSYYIEFSENEEFYEKRSGYPYTLSELKEDSLEKNIFKTGKNMKRDGRS